jgi:hypothetical protein
MTIFCSKRGLGFALFLVSLLLHSFSAIASEFRLKLILEKSEKLENLAFSPEQDTQEPILQIQSTGSSLTNSQESAASSPRPNLHYYVRLKGVSDDLHSSLVYEGREVLISDKKEFEMDVEVKGEIQDFELKKIDKSGKVEVQSAKLLFPEWDRFISEQNSSKRFSLEPRIGLRYATYFQSNYTTSYSQWSLDGTVMSSYWIAPERLNVRVQVTATALPLGSNFSGASTRYFESTSFLEYTLGAHRPDLFILYGGWSFFSAYPSLNTPGFGNVTGPTIGVRYEHLFSKNGKAGLYFHYSPVMSGASFLSYSNYFLEAGADCLLSLSPKGNSLRISLDFDSIQLGVSSLQSSYTSFLWALGYGFF